VPDESRGRQAFGEGISHHFVVAEGPGVEGPSTLAIENENKEIVFTSKGVRPQACVFPLSYVGSLRVYMYMISYKHTNRSVVSGP